MKPLNLLTICLLVFQSHAQISRPKHSENLSLGVGNALCSNGVSGLYNAATIRLDSIRFRIWAGLSNYYLTKELNQVSLQAQVRIGKGGLAFGYSSFGWSNVNQHQFNMAYGLLVAKGFRIGIGAHYLFTKLGKEKAFHQGIYPSIGLAYKHKKFAMAFMIDNPFAINWINTKERLPITFDFGFQFSFTKNFSTYLQLVKTLNTDLRCSLGFEYAIQNKIIPRLAMSFLPLGVSAGLGIQLKQINFGLAFWYGHPLGPITHFDFTYEN